MEAQGGGQVRRLHIIYFISRKGRVDHPHLIRVHHLARNGVHLRDIKRWLSEVRGKEMPDSYAWSYKRKYKTGFVWQDLLDEDLITPISDNEYILKGSEISSTTFNDPNSFARKEAITYKELPSVGVNAKQNIQEHQETPMNFSTKQFHEILNESPPFGSETSTLTNESTKLEEEEHLIAKNVEENQKRNSYNAPFFSIFLSKNSKKIKEKNLKDEKANATSDSSAPKSTFMRSKSYSNNASNMLRNLITCGGVETNDSGMVMINRRSRKNKTDLDMATYKRSSANKMAEICRGEIVGGSERISRISWNQPQQNTGRKSWDGASKKNKNGEMDNIQKPLLPAYRPVNGPNCSQCGKTFNPERLHAHMKSCRGMKALAKGGASSSRHASANSPPRSSLAGHYLKIN